MPKYLLLKHYRGGQRAHDLAGIVGRAPLPRRGQLLRKRSGQPDLIGNCDQQTAAGV